MAHPRDSDDRDAWLRDPRLRALVLRYVKRRVPERDAEDIVQEALIGAWQQADQPATREARVRQVVRIAHHKVIDYLRSPRRHVAEHDEESAPPASGRFAARELLDWLGKQVEGEDEKGLDLLLDEMEGEDAEEAAKRAGLSYEAAKKRKQRLRASLHAAWVAAVAAVALYFGLRHSPAPVALDLDAAPSVPLSAPFPPAPSPAEQARALRDEAYAACAAREYDACESKLAEADALDPAGAQSPPERQASALLWYEHRAGSAEPSAKPLPQVPLDSHGKGPLESMLATRKPCVLTEPKALTAEEAADAGLLAGLPRPYDFDADVEQRRKDALQYFNSGATTRVEGVFVISALDPPMLDEAARLARGALAAWYRPGRFEARLTHAVGVQLYADSGQFRAACAKVGDPKCGKYGYYRACTRDIYVDVPSSTVRTLVHEMVHPIMEEDFPRAREWLKEGLAALYETSVATGDDIEGTDASWRLKDIKRALASPKAAASVRLDALFAMSDDAFDAGDVDLHYAMARYACRWLEKQGKLWSFYAAWRASVASDPSGEKAFAGAVGKTPGEASDEWVEWVNGL